jgi:hypothetical protein
VLKIGKRTIDHSIRGCAKSEPLKEVVHAACHVKGEPHDPQLLSDSARAVHKKVWQLARDFFPSYPKAWLSLCMCFWQFYRTVL